MKTLFISAATVLFFAATAVGQDKVKAPVKAKDKTEATCSKTAKGKSCCTQPSKAAALRMAKPAKTVTAPAPKS
jgi:hypothetical protein